MTKIALVQTNSHIFNLDKNTQNIIDFLNDTQVQKADLVVFPEMCIVGYPLGNVIEKFSKAVDKNLECLEKIAQKTIKNKVIVGFIEKEQINGQTKFYNSLAVLSNGQTEQIIRKSDLLTGEKYYDAKTFDIADKKALIVNLETGFNDRDFGTESLKLQKIKDLIEVQKPDILINCSASVSRCNKEQQKNEFLKTIAQKFQLPLIYVNSVGANEALSFDGISRVYDKNGEIIARAKAFEEQSLLVDLEGRSNEINSLPKGLELPYKKQTKFTLDYEDDLERTYLSVVQAVKDYFKKTGFKRAVLGLSGGLDSTVSAVVLVDALGKENVLGISMPSKITTSASKSDAQILAKNLGINFIETPLSDIFDTTRKTFDVLFDNAEKNWSCRYKKSFTNDNIQARSRATILWGVANEFESCLPIATSDKSEAYMGYATINGDMSGGYAPLADITKTKLFALADWLNKNRKQKNVIPQTILDKRPGAELAINPLTNKPLLAEEALMPYEFLDEVIFRIENLHQTMSEMLKQKFLYEEKEHISLEQKKEWLQKFFKRMSGAHYKWTIMPSAPIVDSFSINSAEYSHPILACETYFEDL